MLEPRNEALPGLLRKNIHHRDAEFAEISFHSFLLRALSASAVNHTEA